MFHRQLVSILQKRLKEKTPLIQVLLGPRQIGKTTAVQTALKNQGLIFTADLPTSFGPEIVQEWWDQALKTKNSVLVIDEVQKIANWSEAVKRLWDQPSKNPIKLVLTGSSSLLVEKGLKETLAGRFELIRAEHWNFKEANEILNLTLSDFLEFGCYPGSVPFLKDKNRWASFIRDSIVEPAIGRDLLQLHPIDDPALLRQLLGVAVSAPAQVLSLQKIQGQLQGRGTLPTLQHYLHLLQEAFLITGVEKYSMSAFRTRRSSPKLIIHDNALIRAFERPVTSPIQTFRKGQYLENAVGARFLEAGWDVFYWKDRDLEVDFIVLGPDGQKWAIEVKSGKVGEKELKGLQIFCKRHKDFEPRFISLKDQKISGIKNLNLEEILSLHRNYTS